MATRSLGQLTLDLVLKNGGFERGMDRSSRKTKKAMSEIKGFVKDAMKTLAAVAGATGFVALIKQQIDVIDTTGELAQQLGTTAAELSTLTYAAEMNGASQDDLRLALRRVSRAIDQAATGTGTYGKKLKELGIATVDANGAQRASTDVLKDVANLFQSLPDGAQKTALAYELLGDNGQRLIPLMNQGAAGMEKFQERARELGLEINDNAVAAAALFNDRLDELKQTSVGFGRQIATDVVPKVNDIVTAMQEANRESGLLMAAFVGLGGIGHSVFIDSLDEDIREVEEQIKAIRENAKGMDGASATAINLGLVGPQTEQQLLELETHLANLQVERDKLEKAEEEAARKALERQKERQAALLAEQEAMREALRLQAEKDRQEREEQQRQAALEKTLQQLNEQKETLGMNSEELLRYRLTAMGATEAQIEMALAAQRTIEEFEEQKKKGEESAKVVEQFWVQAARNMQNAMGDFFYSLGDDIDDVAKNFIDAMRRMLSQAMALATMRWMFGGTAFGDLIGVSGTNAGGGAAMPGQLRQVNEHGPELLSVGGKDYLMMGNQQGQVTPTGKLGGTTIVNNIDARGSVSIVEVQRVAEAAARKGTADALYAMQRGMLPA